MFILGSSAFGSEKRVCPGSGLYRSFIYLVPPVGGRGDPGVRARLRSCGPSQAAAAGAQSLRLPHAPSPRDRVPPRHRGLSRGF